MQHYWLIWNRPCSTSVAVQLRGKGCLSKTKVKPTVNVIGQFIIHAYEYIHIIYVKNIDMYVYMYTHVLHI
jgi:hypothetical protein